MLDAVKGIIAIPLFSTLLSLILTPIIATHFGLRAYRLQSKELVDGAVTWQWAHNHYGGPNEEPFLVIQNRSAVPAFIVRARYKRGLFLRTEARRFAFDYDEPTDGSFPLEVKAAGVTSFPLSTVSADAVAAKAGFCSKWLGYLLKRPYVWIEVSTMSGHRLMVPANDVTSYKDRPLWLEGRWLPVPRPNWMKASD